MTIVASITTGDMSRVFAGRRNAVMTGTAAAQNLCVIDGKHGRPNVRCVAVLANIAGLYVCRGLADGLRAVVAAHTIASDVDVIEVRRQPGDRRMAVVAVVAAGYMGRVFAGRCDAVMTGATSA